MRPQDHVPEHPDHHVDRHLDGVAGARSVEQHIELDAAIDEVWTALTDPARLGEWLGGEVDLDIRPSGTGRVIDDDGTVRDVLVTDVDLHHRVAWHWWDDRNGLSSVEVTLEERGPTTTVRVVEVLVASGDDDERRVTACRRRWTRATSELWVRLSAASVARTTR